MTTMADITVKKFDNTTDITYTGISASAGNNVPAIWRSQSVGNSSGTRPELRTTTKDGGDGKTRKCVITYKYPQIATDSTTSLVSKINQASIEVNAILPNGMPDADANEFAAQWGHIMNTALIIQTLRTMSAAT